MQATRKSLTTEQWGRKCPLPPDEIMTCRHPDDHRMTRNGTLWILHTGAPWRDLPVRFGRWQPVYGRINLCRCRRMGYGSIRHTRYAQTAPTRKTCPG